MSPICCGATQLTSARHAAHSWLHSTGSNIERRVQRLTKRLNTHHESGLPLPGYTPWSTWMASPLQRLVFTPEGPMSLPGRTHEAGRFCPQPALGVPGSTEIAAARARSKRHAPEVDWLVVSSHLASIILRKGRT